MKVVLTSLIVVNDKVFVLHSLFAHDLDVDKGVKNSMGTKNTLVGSQAVLH